MTGDEQVSAMVEALNDLGFSQYEARCYVGLMTREPQTGYRVAKTTGVPQPKVYETLRKLVSRGVVHEIDGDPTLFSAVPPDELFSGLKDTFDRRLGDARDSASHLNVRDTPRSIEYVQRFDQHSEVLQAATECLASAERRVYLSASADELLALRPAIEGARDRGVDMVILAFGRKAFACKGTRVFHHASTVGAVYRHHQARHVALVADSRQAVNAYAADGQTWVGVRSQSGPVIAAVKGFIRHDIDMQQVFADFGPQLVEAYGPGLQRLEGYRQDPTGGATEHTVTTGVERRTG
jgi:sugar-specific transcriptional regulator TrmB